MSSYPSSPMTSSNGDSSSAPQGAAFGYQQSQQSNQQSQPSISPARQLITDAAPLGQALAAFSTQHPELQDTIQQMAQTLRDGLQQAISQQQSPPSGDGGQPAY